MSDITRPLAMGNVASTEVVLELARLRAQHQWFLIITTNESRILASRKDGHVGSLQLWRP